MKVWQSVAKWSRPEGAQPAAMASTAQDLHNSLETGIDDDLPAHAKIRDIRYRGYTTQLEAVTP